jgi:hypothetical protein
MLNSIKSSRGAVEKFGGAESSRNRAIKDPGVVELKIIHLYLHCLDASTHPRSAAATRPRTMKIEDFLFRTSPISTSYSGLVWEKNADLHKLEWVGHFDDHWPV